MEPVKLFAPFLVTAIFRVPLLLNETPPAVIVEPLKSSVELASTVSVPVMVLPASNLTPPAVVLVISRLGAPPVFGNSAVVVSCGLAVPAYFRVAEPP